MCPLIRGNVVQDSMAMNQAFSKPRDVVLAEGLEVRKAMQYPEHVPDLVGTNHCFLHNERGPM